MYFMDVDVIYANAINNWFSFLHIESTEFYKLLLKQNSHPNKIPGEDQKKKKENCEMAQNQKIKYRERLTTAINIRIFINIKYYVIGYLLFMCSCVKCSGCG